MGEIFALKTLGESMYPTFTEGMTLIAKKTKNISEGEIIIFRKDKKLIAHRVVEINGDQIITKGDNRNKPDPFTVNIKQVIGKAILIQDHNGSLRKVPAIYTPGTSRTIREFLVSAIRSFNSNSLYNLYISALAPFLRSNKSRQPLLNFKKQFFHNGAGSFSRPKECLNFELFSIPVASILKFNDLNQITYIRSAFERNRSIKNQINKISNSGI